MGQQPGELNHYLYEKIYNELRAEILGGVYSKGDWFPPERVLKERFKTTHLTVRNALAKLVLDGFIERYSGKGTVVIYSPLQGAPQVPRLRVKQVHFIVARIGPSNAEFLNALEEGLRRLSVPLRLSCHHDDALLEGSLCRQAAEEESLVVLEPSSSPSSVFAAGGSLPRTIVVNAVQESFDGPQIAADEADGARRAARHLLSLGHGSIALVTSGDSFAARERRRGLEEALAECAPPAQPVLEDAVPGVAGGADACARILERVPGCRAFLCASDESAAGALRQLRAAGLVPGRNCAVIAFGSTPLAEAEGITSVDIDPRAVAEQVLLAIRAAATRSSFPRGTSLVKPELRLRDSCGRP